MKTLLSGLLAIALLALAMPTSKPAEIGAPAERNGQRHDSESSTKSLQESALEDYITSYRIESTLLIAKIAGDETKRAFMKMIEKAIKDMTEARQELTQAVRKCDEEADSADLLRKLRLALAAREKDHAFIQAVLLSNSIMFVITAITRTYADDELDARLARVITTGDAPSTAAVERLLKRIEERLASSRR